MAKTKQDKSVQNKHQYSRASYLYQAAAYLSACSTQTSAPAIRATSAQNTEGATSVTPDIPTDASPLVHGEDSAMADTKDDDPTTRGLPQGSTRHLLTHLRRVGLKSHTRLSRDIKRSICKRCDTLLVPGQTSTAGVENQSKGARKPWADVYVVRCLVCGGVKRFPVGVERQGRKGSRGKGEVEREGEGERVEGTGKEEGRGKKGKKETKMEGLRAVQDEARKGGSVVEVAEKEGAAA